MSNYIPVQELESIWKWSNKTYETAGLMFVLEFEAPNTSNQTKTKLTLMHKMILFYGMKHQHASWLYNLLVISNYP